MAEASPSSMSAAAQAYQESMEKYGQREQSTPAPTPAPASAPSLSATTAPALQTTVAAAGDTPMADAAVCNASIPHYRSSALVSNMAEFDFAAIASSTTPFHEFHPRPSAHRHAHSDSKRQRQCRIYCSNAVESGATWCASAEISE